MKIRNCISIYMRTEIIHERYNILARSLNDVLIKEMQPDK